MALGIGKGQNGGPKLFEYCPACFNVYYKYGYIPSYPKHT